MNRWVVKNSFQKTIFEADLATIEAWNDIIFLYSKILNNTEVYKKNYLFFTTSTNAPFSKEEILNCIDYVFSLLDDDNFSKTLNKEDRITFFELFLELKTSVVIDQNLTFSTALSF